MGYDWTDPSPSELAREAAADEMVANDMEEAEKLRAIMEVAVVAVKKLRFDLGCPTPGYDIEDIISTLEDMRPPSAKVLEPQLEQAAYDRAGDL